MAPLNPNNTQRFWLRYTSKLVEHELEFRLNETKTAADGATAATALANALKTFLPTADSFLSLRRSAPGSNLSFPVAFTPIAGTNSTAAADDNIPSFLSIVGRSALGRRVRMTVFSPYDYNDPNYRINRSESGGIDAWLDVVEDPSYGFVAVDDVNVIWNQYGNVGYNAYWIRERRKSS